MKPEDEIDWTQFGDTVTSTAYCRCGMVFRSHAKAVNIEGRWKCVSRIPCPQCGQHDNIYRVSTDPEQFIINS